MQDNGTALTPEEQPTNETPQSAARAQKAGSPRITVSGKVSSSLDRTMVPIYRSMGRRRPRGQSGEAVYGSSPVLMIAIERETANI
jgi:hypothetical protein